MAYEIHITRKKHWYDEKRPEITNREWAEIVNSDEELGWDKYNGPDDVLWKGKHVIPLWYSHGIISTKNPSRETIKKMFQIAIKLNAVVQGDEGELYDENGRQLGICEEQIKPPKSQRLPKPWSNTEKIIITFIVVFLFKIAVFGYLSVHDYRYSFIQDLAFASRILDGIVIVRLLLGVVFKERSNGWTYYLFLIFTSPAWILLIAKFEIALVDAKHFNRIHLGDIAIPFVWFIVLTLVYIFGIKILNIKLTRMDNEKLK